MSPVIGSKVKDKHAAQWVEQLTYKLGPHEQVRAIFSIVPIMRPMCDGMVVTDRRLGLFSGSEIVGKGLKRELMLIDVMDFDIRSKGLTQNGLYVTARQGGEMFFGAVPAPDVGAVLQALRAPRSERTPQYLPATSAATPTPTASPASSSLTEELRGLAALRAEGVLSELEFLAAKQSAITRFSTP